VLDAPTLAACSVVTDKASVQAIDLSGHGPQSDQIGPLRSILPLAFSNVTALGFTGITMLNLSYNGIAALPDVEDKWNGRTFEGLNQLKTLDFRNNQLDRLGVVDGVAFGSPFLRLPQLRELRLDANQLESIGASAFVGPDALTTLGLSGNMLATVSDGLCGPLMQTHDGAVCLANTDNSTALSGVTTLDLSNNRLNSLGPAAFGTLSRLANLNLLGNAAIAIVGKGAWGRGVEEACSFDPKRQEYTGLCMDGHILSSTCTLTPNRTVMCACAPDRFCNNIPQLRLDGGEQGEPRWRQ